MMRIRTLAENTKLSDDFACEHGLSLYIETGNTKILFDVGASELFLENARRLHIDIAAVDALVISHGHADHGGGLEAFLQANQKAKVYLHPLAFSKHYARRPDERLDDIGLDAAFRQHERMVFTCDRFAVSDRIHVFSNVAQIEPLPQSNSSLFREVEGQLRPDDFAHEQNLVVEEEGKIFLVTGCAHNGILNILRHFEALEGRLPDYLIGGFHLSSRSSGAASPAEIDRIAHELRRTGVRLSTCHCTGLRAYRRLKSVLGSRINYLSSGSEVTL